MTETPDRPTEDPRPQVDLARSADLGDYLAAVAVHRDGHETLWLMRNDDAGTLGCACANCAPFEQLDAQHVVPTHAVRGDR